MCMCACVHVPTHIAMHTACFPLKLQLVFSCFRHYTSRVSLYSCTWIHAYIYYPVMPSHLDFQCAPLALLVRMCQREPLAHQRTLCLLPLEDILPQQQLYAPHKVMLSHTIPVCVCVCVNVSIFMCACMYVCMYVCVYILHTYTHILHTYTHTNIYI